MGVLFRSEYSNTWEAFNTATYSTTKVIKMVFTTCLNQSSTSCTRSTCLAPTAPHRWSAYVESLLFMADFYCMEDLKDAVAPHLGPKLDEDNILEI